MGNNGRYLNHSCNPNSEIQIWESRGECRVGIFSTRHINKGDEITIDYQFDNFSEPIKCYCGEKNCKGFIGKKPEEKKEKPKVFVENVVKVVNEIPTQQPQTAIFWSSRISYSNDEIRKIRKNKLFIVGGKGKRRGLFEGYSRRLNSIKKYLSKCDEKRVNNYINTFKEEQKYMYIKTNRYNKNDSICRRCKLPGTLVLCDYCTAAFHMTCCGLFTIPSGKWMCPECKKKERESRFNKLYC